MAIVVDTSELTPKSQLSRNHQEWVYNGLDCCVTYEVLEALLEDLDPVSQRTYDFSLSLQAPVLEMATRGLRVDQRQREFVRQKFITQTKQLEEQLYRLTKEGIGVGLANWKSPPQLKSLLYDVMGLPPVRKRNAKGRMAPTVNRDALESLGNYFLAEPICNHVLALRELGKKIGFLETGIDPDGRMRCNFNIAGTNTGRLASSMSDFGTGTNLQNVDRDLRSVFIADPGYKFANLDLEQADARNVGAICWNLFHKSHGHEFAGAYLDACESGDLHTYVCKMAWAELAWGAGDDRNVADQLAYRQDSYRQLAKKLGHGTNYYGSPRTMAKHTKVAENIIKEFQRKYFHAFPCIGSFPHNRDADNWHNRIRTALKLTHSLTTTNFDRRRFFWGRHWDDATLREAIAYEPQSMTADEIDTGIINLWRANLVQLLVQVHDNILFQFPEEQEDEIIPWAKEALRVPMVLAGGREFCVPVDAKTGWNWGDEHDENPDGLKSYKGGDTRKRTDRRLSVATL